MQLPAPSLHLRSPDGVLLVCSPARSSSFVLFVPSPLAFTSPVLPHPGADISPPEAPRRRANHHTRACAMERSRSYTGDLFVIERVSPAGFMGMRSRSANLHSFSEASPCAGRATTPAVDFLSPHLHHSARSSLSPSPAVGSGSFREHHDTTRTPWRLQQNQNPFYDHPQFRQYRSRQEQKDEKDGQKWPPILENPFLDGESTSAQSLSGLASMTLTSWS